MDETARLINRVSGSGAFVNAARSVLVLARHPEDPEGEGGRERVLVHVASNWGRLAPTLTARVGTREVDIDDGSRASVGYLQITGQSDITLEDLQGDAKHSAAEVDEAIAQALKDGSRASREVKAQVAKELDCSTKTVERHAVKMKDRGELGVEPRGFPKTTTWWLLMGTAARRQ